MIQSFYKEHTMTQRKVNIAESNEALKKLADLLLDENVEAKVATTYRTISTQTGLIEKPAIPGSNYWISGSQTLNTNRATSVTIGKFTIRKWPNGAGFHIITPEGKDYSFSGNLNTNIRAISYIWAAALAKCDKRYHEVVYYLKEMRSLGIKDPKTTKGSVKTKFEEAQTQMESLGVPKESQVHLQKLRGERE